MEYYYIFYITYGSISAIVSVGIFIFGINMINEGWNDHDVSYLWLGLAAFVVSIIMLLGLGMTFFHWFAPVIGPR